MRIDDLSSSFDRGIATISYHQPYRQSTPPRLIATSEQLEFDVLLVEDSGEYRCSVKHDNHVSYRTIHLEVIISHR